MSRRSLISTLCLLLFIAALPGEAPIRTEETLYSIAAFSGRDYALTFAKENASTIYVHSDANNFMSLKKNFTYFWPITDQWMLDDSILDITYEGTIEITDNKGVKKTLEPVDYTFFNMRGTYQNNWHVRTGAEAVAEWTEYVDIVLNYQAAMTEYNRAHAAYQERTSQLFNQILMRRGEDKPFEHLLEELETIKPPEEPAKPTKYTVPPVKLQKGFQINLPEGEYSLRFIATDGKVIEGSEKTLISVAGRRLNAIGYEVFPAVRWTQPSSSTTPSSVLYVDGTSDLYVRPFFQTEYRDMHYNKLINNQKSGNPNLYTWVKIQQVPHSSMQITTDTQVREVTEGPYIVEQTKTSAMGYTIVPYDPTGEHKGKIPSVSALYIPLSPQMKALEFSLTNLEDAAATASSKRSIRIIRGVQHEILSLALLVLPLIVLLFVLIKRRRSYRR